MKFNFDTWTFPFSVSIRVDQFIWQCLCVSDLHPSITHLSSPSSALICPSSSEESEEREEHLRHTHQSVSGICLHSISPPPPPPPPLPPPPQLQSTWILVWLSSSYLNYLMSSASFHPSLIYHHTSWRLRKLNHKKLLWRHCISILIDFVLKWQVPIVIKFC